MNAMRWAFHQAVNALRIRDELWTRPAWVHDLARELAQEATR